jgi:hypothetical protein
MFLSCFFGFFLADFPQSMVRERVNTLKSAMLCGAVLAFEAQRTNAEMTKNAIGDEGEKTANAVRRIQKGGTEKRRRRERGWQIGGSGLFFFG